MEVPERSTMPSSYLPSRRAASIVASSTAWNKSNTCACAAGSSPSSLRGRLWIWIYHVKSGFYVHKLQKRSCAAGSSLRGGTIKR